MWTDVLFGVIGTILFLMIFPIFIGIGVALLIGAVGGLFYFIIISVSLFLWLIFGVILWL